MTYNELLKKEEYAFLRKEKQIAYLTVAGSRAYGTNTPTSDWDLRGFFMEDMDTLLGMIPGREQIFDKKTDTTIYSFRKFISLVTNCNPNVIELLGTKPEFHILTSDVFEDVLAHKHLFLTKKAFYTFAGYALAQFRRLKNGLAFRDGTKEDVEKNLVESLNMEVMRKDSDFFVTPDTNNDISFYLDENDETDADSVVMDCNYKALPVRAFINIAHDMENTVKNYGKLTNRNHKKDDAHLYKHAMHLIRLYYTGIDILRYGEINTFREKEHDFLMAVRNGEVSFDEVFAHQQKMEVEMRKAYEESKLPDAPDMERINEFVINVRRKCFGLK